MFEGIKANLLWSSAFNYTSQKWCLRLWLWWYCKNSTFLTRPLRPFRRVFHNHRSYKEMGFCQGNISKVKFPRFQNRTLYYGPILYFYCFNFHVYFRIHDELSKSESASTYDGKVFDRFPLSDVDILSPIIQPDKVSCVYCFEW